MYSHTLYNYPLNCLHTYERSFWQAQSHTWIYNHARVQQNVCIPRGYWYTFISTIKYMYIHVHTTFDATKIARINIQNHMCLCTGILSTVLHIIFHFLAHWASIHPHSRTISPISRGIRPCAFAVRWIFCLCKWKHQDSFISQRTVLPIINPKHIL